MPRLVNAGKAAKHRRDGGDVQEYNMHIKKELGDVMWQVAAVAKDHGTVVRLQLEKLSSRPDVIQGSGTFDRWYNFRPSHT
jgi:hypothetical protein